MTLLKQRITRLITCKSFIQHSIVNDAPHQHAIDHMLQLYADIISKDVNGMLIETLLSNKFQTIEWDAVHHLIRHIVLRELRTSTQAIGSATHPCRLASKHFQSICCQLAKNAMCDLDVHKLTVACQLSKYSVEMEAMVILLLNRSFDVLERVDKHQNKKRNRARMIYHYLLLQLAI